MKRGVEEVSALLYLLQPYNTMLDKVFLRKQCKGIEENNRMGRTRNLLKKIRDIKKIFQAKIGTIKERNGMDLTEAEDIKKRWQEHTEELYKKDFNDPDRPRHPGM